MFEMEQEFQRKKKQAQRRKERMRTKKQSSSTVSYAGMKSLAGVACESVGDGEEEAKGGGGGGGMGEEMHVSVAVLDAAKHTGLSPSEEAAAAAAAEEEEEEEEGATGNVSSAQELDNISPTIYPASLAAIGNSTASSDNVIPEKVRGERDSGIQTSMIQRLPETPMLHH